MSMSNKFAFALCAMACLAGASFGTQPTLALALSLRSKADARAALDKATATASAGVEWATGRGGDYDHLRYSVLRIESVAKDFDWLMPFSMRPEGVGLGSGFVVETEDFATDPIIITV